MQGVLTLTIGNIPLAIGNMPMAIGNSSLWLQANIPNAPSGIRTQDSGFKDPRASRLH